MCQIVNHPMKIMKRKSFVTAIIICMVLLNSCGSKKWVITVPGENLSALSKVTEGDEICQFPFGGDNGKSLFFSVFEGKGNYANIYKKENPFSPSLNQRTSGNNGNLAPTYCEATDKVAFAGRLEGNIRSDIYIMSASQGKALTQITNTPDASEHHPCLSKDGQLIVYEKNNGGISGPGSEIWMKNLQTGETTLLCKGRMPSFSPDGKQIVYMKYASDTDFSCIWIMDTDGDNQVQVTDANLGLAGYPRFSPDGKFIIFDLTKKKKKDDDLYIIQTDGNNLTQLTVNKSYDGQPYWANDGNIYFVSDRGGKADNRQIWRFKAPVETAIVNEPVPTQTNRINIGSTTQIRPRNETDNQSTEQNRQTIQVVEQKGNKNK